MHPNDQMTPRERAAALQRGEPVDRMPISLFYGAPAHALLGWTRQQEKESGRSMAAVQRKVYETFGSDGVSISYGLHAMAESLGAQMSQDPHVPSSILRHPISDIRDLSLLDLDKMTVENNAKAGKCFDAVRILRDELGDEVDAGFSIPGPFTCASGLVGPGQLLKAMLRQGQQVQQLLELVTKALIQISTPFLLEGFGVGIADPLASGSVLSPKQFRTFVKPWHQTLVAGLKAVRPLGVSCHICGDTSLLLEDMADSGFSTISLDNQMDLLAAKERIGRQVRIMGNVDPVNVLYRGTPQQVRQAVCDCYRKGWDSPRGYLLALGCDAVYGTPLENALAFMEAGRACAKYPVSPENFIAVR